MSHHPLIFHGLKSITDTDPTGAVVRKMIERGIALISAHTNFDQATNGVSDVLLARLGAVKQGFLEPAGETADSVPYGMGTCGVMQTAMSPRSFVEHVRDSLDAKGVRAALGDRPIKKVAVCGGAGGDLLALAAKWGADAYVTADVKYHEFLEAKQRGITLVDGGHFATENPSMDTLRDCLEAEFEGQGVEVLRSTAHKEVYFSL